MKTKFEIYFLYRGRYESLQIRLQSCILEENISQPWLLLKEAASLRPPEGDCPRRLRPDVWHRRGSRGCFFFSRCTFPSSRKVRQPLVCSENLQHFPAIQLWTFHWQKRETPAVCFSGKPLHWKVESLFKSRQVFSDQRNAAHVINKSWWIVRIGSECVALFIFRPQGRNFSLNQGVMIYLWHISIIIVHI